VTVYVRRGYADLTDAAWSPAVAIAFSTVGAMILTQRPGHPIGRLCLAIGLLLGLQLALAGVAAVIDVRPGRMPPFLVAAAVIADQLQVAAIGLLPPLLARFPSGRLPGDRWRLIDACVAVYVVTMAMTVLQPGPAPVDWILEAPNPLGMPGLPMDVVAVGFIVGSGAFVLGGVLSVAALTLTYRRADRPVRAQIRWVLAPTALLLAAVLVMVVVPPLRDAAGLVVGLVPTLIPIGIGVAILRYHLYDIDRIVGRTITYGAITGILAAAFLGTNVVLQAVLSPAIGSNGIVIALSTLLVASLAAPLRGRVQGVVDRRFNRAHYDAERTVAALAGQLRDEVDLETIRHLTLASTTGAVQPAFAALWLRDAAEGGPSPASRP
jgi:hypothetical protein